MRSLIGLAVLLAACSNGGSTGAPPDIVYGRDICIECGMIISDERTAAAYEFAGTDRAFDDIGDMLAYGLRSGELTASTPAWVHDWDGGGWIDVAAAWFVTTDPYRTPMGHGIVAFATRQQADRFSAEYHGSTLTWGELLAHGSDDVHDHQGA